MAPIFRFILFSGSKKKEPRYVCLSEAKASHSHKTCTEVSSRVPRNMIWDAPFPEPSFICHSTLPVSEPPPDSPTGAPMERVACLQSLLLYVLQIPHKIPLLKNYFFLSKALGKEHPSMFPKEWGPYGNRHPFPEPYLAYPSGSPVKEPSLQVPIIELPQRDTSPLPGSPMGPLWREMPISRAFLYISSRVPESSPPSMFPSQTSLIERCPISRSHLHPSLEVPGKWAPSKFPSGALMARDARPQSLLHITFRVPCKGPPPPSSPHRASIRRDAPFPEPFFNYFSEFLVNGTPHDSRWGPYGERCPSPEPSSTHKSPENEAPSRLPPQRLMPVPWALLHISFQIPSKGAPPPRSPNKAPAERDAPFLKPSYYLPKFPVNGSPRTFFSGALMERDTCFQNLPSKSPLKEPPSMFPNRVPMERNALSPEPMVYSFIYIC